MRASEDAERTITDLIIETGVVGGLIGIAGIALAAILAAAFARRAARRERYAAMAATLAAWGEVPFRIKRRTSNNAACVESLAMMLHEIQQQLVVDHTDLLADSRWLARSRDDAQRAIQEQVHPWIAEAWASPPITSTSEMNLNGWGPTGVRGYVEEFADDVRWRFGWRRIASPARRAWRQLRR